jgi:flagellar motor switch protein FliN/FliY
MSDDDKEKPAETTAESVEDDPWAGAMEEQADEESKAEAINLETFEAGGNKGKSIDPDLDIILDIPVNISMAVGSTSITIRNLLQLNQGSVIELDRLAGEPLDVLVNGTLIAHGEVVVVNEKFGIRMTDVISPAERIKNLA